MTDKVRFHLFISKQHLVLLEKMAEEELSSKAKLIRDAIYDLLKRKKKIK